MHSGKLFWSALTAFLALPGMVAFVLPWLMRPASVPFDALGLWLLLPGLCLLLWCVRDFYVAGRGSLAPWAPPVNLVTVGLYRVTRNPMYVAVTVILLGWSLAFRSRGLLTYVAAVAVMFELRVLFFEEPWLARTHGERWLSYKASVPRWLFWLPFSRRGDIRAR